MPCCGLLWLQFPSLAVELSPLRRGSRLSAEPLLFCDHSDMLPRGPFPRGGGHRGRLPTGEQGELRLRRDEHLPDVCLICLPHMSALHVCLIYKVSCGCDATSIYLQTQPGWSDFARGGESAAAGALIEFHRRRMAYFVGVVKRAIRPDVWGELREAFPDLLHDVLAGRSIQWDEVDAAEHPKFGTRAASADLIQDEARQLQMFVRATLDTSHDGGGKTDPVLPAAVPRHEQVVTSNTWLEQLIVLSETAPVVIKYQVMATGSDTQIIGAFSLNRQHWDQGDCDALTWFAASHRDDFTFRHGMFEGFPPAGRGAPFKLRLGQWHLIQVSLSLRAVEYSVDGRTFATLQNERRRGLVQHVDSGYWPSRGYIGMIHAEGDWKFRDLEIVTASTAASHRRDEDAAPARDHDGGQRDGGGETDWVCDVLPGDTSPR